MSADLPFFLTQNSGIQTAEPEDELLHPEQNKLIGADSLTETQYFGFCVPSEQIQAFCYLVHHPNLHVVSGGLFAFRGHTHTVVHSELCDYRCYMKDDALKEDLHEYRLDNGYSVKIVQSLKHHRIRYSDERRGNSVDVDIYAVQPPVMFGDGKHFEQPMKVRGNLVLRGKHYNVDCFTVRDRSWGKARTEENLEIPAVSWMVGVFNEEFSFSATVFDQCDDTPELTGGFALPIDKTVNGGWLYRDGQLGRIVAAKKRVVRARETFLPLYVELELRDHLDRSIQLRGTSVASTVWQTWVNMLLPICQMRWECEGLVAYGECQEGNFNDQLNLYRGR